MSKRIPSNETELERQRRIWFTNRKSIFALMVGAFVKTSISLVAPFRPRGADYRTPKRRELDRLRKRSMWDAFAAGLNYAGWSKSAGQFRSGHEEVQS